MYLLRLFHRAEPAQPVAAHVLRDGITRVGRDPEADWLLADPDCEISRHHFELTCRDGALALRPLGTNGVFREGNRLPDGGDVPLSLGDAVEFGPFRMVVDKLPFAARSGASFERTMVFASPFGERRETPSEWADAVGFRPESGSDSGEASLLEAFCEGARLDVSALSAEDPAEILRRAGAIYRQMVLGLGDLVAERAGAKADLSLDRTTIGAADNNPVKWAPTQRLATDLLRGTEAGFLDGPEAIRESFQDVKAHMLGTLAGFEAVLRAALESIGPEAIGRRIEGRQTLLKSRPQLCWTEYERLHAELQTQLSERRDGPLAQAFQQGYEQAATDRAA